MRFDLNNEPTIGLLHYVSRPDAHPVFLQFVRDNAIVSAQAEKQFEQCYSTLNNVFCNLNVELISSRFEKEVEHSTRTLIESIEDDNLYELLGERSGIMMLSNNITVYKISKDYVLLWTLPRYKKARGTISWLSTDMTYKCLMSQSESNRVHCTALLVLLFKEKTEVKTQEITTDSIDRKPLGVKRVSVSDRIPFRVKQTDCSWFTTYYTDRQIPVRGFWRLQACGVNHSERKLIYVHPFVKNGYHRGAKMLNCA